MKILFIHQNFPGQFKFLAPALVQQGHEVVAMIMQKTDLEVWQGVKLVAYFEIDSIKKYCYTWLVIKKCAVSSVGRADPS